MGYAWTHAGLQIGRWTWPNGQTGTFLYDGLGRLTNLTYSTGGGWSYAYDARDFVVRRVDVYPLSYAGASPWPCATRG